ncbi:MAG: hypothetical protein ACI4MQ_07120 [Candidatus Coproplasma sp.]
MTKQEFEELDQDHKEMWIEMGKETIERWVKKQEIINLPYPENIIRFAYGSQSVLKEGYEAAFAEIEKTLSIKMIEPLCVIFKEHSTLNEAADKLGIMNFSVLGAAMRVARCLRNWGRVRKIREFVEFHWDESETEES